MGEIAATVEKNIYSGYRDAGGNARIDDKKFPCRFLSLPH